jgi:hypothetical protein
LAYVVAGVTVAPRQSTLVRVGFWCLVLARGSCGAALAISLGWCVTRAPRGFAPFSWPFFEHQVFLPALAVLAGMGALSTLLRRSPRYALRDAFWGVALPIALVVAVVGNTSYAAWFAGAVVFSAAVLLAPRVLRAEWRRGKERVRFWALVLGASFGLLFSFATLAPRATTHPLPGEPKAPDWSRGLDFRADSPVALELDGFRVNVTPHPVGNGPISVEMGGQSWDIDPAFELSSYSQSGLWTVFDYHSERPPRWEVASVDAKSVALRARSALLSTNALVRIEGGELSVQSVTHVRRELCVHLARALAIHGATGDSEAKLHVDGNTWETHETRYAGLMPFLAAAAELGPLELLAYRRGKLELLRATEDEKGPFITLATLADHDPWLEVRGVRFQIRGFARQAAREPSPTAGYGVSQAAIQARGDDIRVELAATAVGRGWNTVRIAPGMYDLTVAAKKLR